ncbi:NAD(P)H-dependent flavin oxidoreductase [Defluviitalea phaphyphila]|uniref:NAD(P)H-dependent flavin oxidoreductase n=1 Tax=Defluviitalea phaphyphila TaxID=1473580 RepID=UPI000730D8DA|nr:nitronate monooxygenase family protein [Defluviitalea phaphyphila]
MKLPSLKIGNLIADIPIIQGGMGIGISRAKLASAVANEGGIGIISGVQIGFNEPDFETNNKAANIRGLQKEIRKARKLSPKGIIGVNLLTAMNNYKEMILTAVKEKIDLIICGAGLPVDLPELVENSASKIIPIVSSSKAATIITKLWDRRYNRIPDALIVEGPKAGGHLGFSLKELNKKPIPNLADIVKEVLSAIKPFEKKYNKKIPVIAAGGIFDGYDIAKHIKIGASGVQMATRFVTTYECDAHDNYKKAYINASKDQIQIIKSPVGMPGRAIRNKLIETLEKTNKKISKCYNCLKPCDPSTTPYCISEALIKALKGDTDNGLIFAGSNVYKLNKIISVKELINELVNETLIALT